MTALGLTGAAIPRTIILLGVLDVVSHAARWRSHFDRVTETRLPNLYIGQRAGGTCAFAAAYGGPMAATYLHAFAVMGAERAILIGSCGGLEPTLQVGEFVVPDRVAHEDGGGRLYRPGMPETAATPTLNAELAAALRERGARVRGGLSVSTDSFLAETVEDIARWQQQGCVGVDMEASTVFAVADHFGIERAAALYVIDPIGAGRDALALTEAERLTVREARRIQIEAVLTVALQ